MPSTVTDFALRTKKMAADVAVAYNYSSENDYNWAKSNPFKRSVTFNSVGFSISSTSIVAGGVGYTTATLTFSAPSNPGGVTATGTATLSSGSIISVTITNVGSGYTSAPTITVTGNGTSANITATLATGTDQVMSFVIDTLGAYYFSPPYFAGFTGNDLRVYDTDGVSPLSFWVEAPSTTYTTVFVKFPTLSAGNRQIWIEYGNPALDNIASASSTLGTIFASTRMKAWFRGNDINRLARGGLKNNDTVSNWVNRVNRHKSALNSDSTTWPLCKTNIQNGLPVLRLDGTNDNLLCPDVVIPASSGYHIFAVDGRNTSASQPIVGDTGPGALNSSLFFGFRNTSTLTCGQFSNDLDATIAAFGTKTFTLYEGELNTSTGHFLRMNGVQLATNANTTGLATDNNLRIGYGPRFSPNYYKGDLGDVIIFAGTALNSTERGQVQNYLNAKWKLYNTANFPTSITIGSEAAATATPFAYTSHAHLSEFSTDIKLSNSFFGIAPATGKGRISNLFVKTFASGSSVEGWTNSSSDTTGKLSVPIARKLTVSTTAATDSLILEKITTFGNPELLTNNEFLNWTGDNPDDWTVSEGSPNLVTQVSNGARMVTSGPNVAIQKVGLITTNLNYRLNGFISSYTTGTLNATRGTLADNSGPSVNSAGEFNLDFKATGADFGIKRNQTVGAMDLVLRRLSLKRFYNWNDLSVFNQQNYVVSTVYSSSDTDWIEFDYYADNAALIDKTNTFLKFETKNLLSFSNLLSNAVWQKDAGVAVTTGQTDPDGGTTAAIINFGASSRVFFQRSLQTYQLGMKYSFSIWVKGTAGETILVNLSSRTGGGSFLDFTSTVVTLSAAFQKVTLTLTLTATSATMADVRAAVSTYSPATATSLTVGFPQLEYGASATTYSPNSGTALSYQANLNQNINTLESAKLCSVRIKKSSFTKVGTGDWSSVYSIKMSHLATSGTQSVYYGYFRLIKNINLDTNYQTGLPVQLKNYVTSDNETTYFGQNVLEGKIKARTVSSDDIEFDVVDYLDIIKGKTFGELDSFPSGFAYWSLPEELGPGNALKAGFHTFAVEKVLGFIFPRTLFDVSLEWLLEEDTENLFGSLSQVDTSITNLNGFWLKSTDKIGETLEALLGACLGYMTYDEKNGKLIARNGYAAWLDYTYTLSTSVVVDTLPSPTVIDTEKSLYSYKSEGLSDEYLVNYMDFSLLQDSVKTNYAILSFSDSKTYELKASGVTVVWFSPEDYDKIAEIVTVLNNFYVEDWGVTTTSTDTTYSKTGVKITRTGIVGNSLFLEFTNSNASVRFLRFLLARADSGVFAKTFTYISFTGSSSQASTYDGLISDSASIKQFGQKKLTLDNRYIYAGLNNSGDVVTPVLYLKVVDKFKSPVEVLQAEVQYSPDYRIGQIVQVRTKEKRTIKAEVLAQSSHSQGGEYVKTITVREIVK